MQKLSILLLAVVMTMSLCGCNKAEKNQENNSTTLQTPASEVEETPNEVTKNNTFYVKDIPWNKTQEEIKNSVESSFVSSNGEHLQFSYDHLETTDQTNISVTYTFQDGYLREVFVDLQDQSEETFLSLVEYFGAEEWITDGYRAEYENSMIYLSQDLIEGEIMTNITILQLE